MHHVRKNNTIHYFARFYGWDTTSKSTFVEGVGHFILFVWHRPKYIFLSNRAWLHGDDAKISSRFLPLWYRLTPPYKHNRAGQPPHHLGQCQCPTRWGRWGPRLMLLWGPQMVIPVLSIRTDTCFAHIYQHIKLGANWLRYALLCTFQDGG